MSAAGELNPPARFLMGPGPSDVHPRVLKAMSTPLIGHLDPQFIAIMDGVMGMLRQLFGTTNEVTFPVSATGSAGMETCFVNLLEPGDEALVCVNGVFGNRMCDNVERCGGKLGPNHRACPGKRGAGEIQSQTGCDCSRRDLDGGASAAGRNQQNSPRCRGPAARGCGNVSWRNGCSNG